MTSGLKEDGAIFGLVFIFIVLMLVLGVFVLPAFG